MKLITSILIICFLCQNWSYSQCNIPEPPSLTCLNAPVLCDLNGYCSTSLGNNPQPTPNAFCGVVENASWLAFVAGSANLSIRITPDNCNNNAGMQGHILQTDDCNFFVSASNCFDPAGGGAPAFTLNSTNLIIGEKYYLLLDGKGGDVCDFEIEVLSGQTVSPNFLVAVDNPVYFCQGETESSIEVEDNFTGGVNTLYFWVTQNGDILSTPSEPIIDIGATGDYTIFAIDTITLCKDTVTIEALDSEEIIAELALPETINCLTNFKVVISPENYSSGQNLSYEWRNLNGELLGVDILSLEVEDPGEYIFTVIDNQSGCQKSDTVEVLIDIQTPIANAGGNQELNCVYPTLVLDGGNSSKGNNFTYNWTTDNGNILSGGNTLFPEIGVEGNYFLSILNEENGCVSKDTVTVELNEKVPESVQFSINQPCFGESSGSFSIESIEGGNPPYRFSLDDSTFTALLNFPLLPIDNYHLIIKDEIGCEYDTTFQIMELEELILDIEPALEIKLGESLILPALTNRDENELSFIQWVPGQGLSCDSCLNPIANPLLSTAYELSIADENNCTASVKTVLTINRQSCVYIPNIFSPNGDGSNDVFFVNGIQNIESINHFQVFHRWGGMIFEKKDIQANDPTVGWDGLLNGQPVNSGVYPYFIEVEFIDGRQEVYFGTITLVR
ncbi:MAG: gliding motility-associated C-terminal domain-containing protein [Bacteroidetes bacterium]|nr:gliding motility-associated C-terminal domain-containing protein [Bacteroidota bacterium]